MTKPIVSKDPVGGAQSIGAEDHRDGQRGRFPAVLADRFQRFKYRHFGPNIDHYQRLAEMGQHPKIMVVSCCDSRVDPETIFTAMPGELFIVRNVASLVPPFETGGQFHGVSAALEFATLNLKVEHILVLGHALCGGVKAALDETAAIQTEAQFITRWISMLDDARANVMKHAGGTDSDQIQYQLELEGIRTSLTNLRTFPFIQELEAKGLLSLHGAHFDIAKGELSVLNQEADCFESV